MNTARTVALAILTEVLNKRRSLATVLAQQLPMLAEAEQALCKQLCFGVMREYFYIQHLLKPFLRKPLKAKDTDVQVILFLGTYQLLWLATADHAAIHETVNLCKHRHKPWASKLVNAILRNIQRQKLSVPNDIVLSHPTWLCTQLQHDWPQHWQEIMQANQKPPPMTVRVADPESYQQQLHAAGITATCLPQAPQALLIENPVPVQTLPGFENGEVSVQDAAAQQVAPLMDLQPQQRVLDACAAPGGKTLHMLHDCPEIQMTAVDKHAARLEKVQKNLARQQHTAHCITGDASQQDWWDKQAFDRILCDVPCSATGIIRRQPDIKVLRQAEDLPALQHTQAAILRNCWQMLKPGGILLYTTCSVLPAENDQQIETFLAHTPQAHCLPLPTIPGKTTAYGVQSLPGEESQDGFYYAKLQKSTKAD